MASQIHPFQSSRSSSITALKLGNLLLQASVIVALPKNIIVKSLLRELKRDLPPSLVERTVLVTFAEAILSPQRTSSALIITAVTLRPYLGPFPSADRPFLPYRGIPFAITASHQLDHQE